MSDTDPITAIVDQLAAHAEQLTRLDARHADHHAAVSARLAELTGQAAALGHVVEEHAAALTRLTAPSQTGPDGDGYCPEPAPAWWKLAADDRPEPIARLRGWVEQVYRPGYGHLAAGLGPCWPAHDLCLYALDIACRTVVGAVPPARPQPRTAVRPGRIPGPHPARPRRPAPRRDQHLRPPPPPHAGPRPALEHAMTDATLRQALAFATRGWPVLPCQPGQKTPATRHGVRDATTDPGQITAWFGRHPDWNLAIATGAPGPDVLDVDQHGEAGNGYAAFRQLRAAGLLDGARAWVRTPSGGLHAYFTGTGQRNGHLPAHHLDFRSRGGYVLTPPSRIGGKPYQLIQAFRGRGTLDWEAVIQHLQPQRQPSPRHPQPGRQDLSGLARWVASQAEGNRNAGLFWAANRALDADPAADLSPLAAAARQAGLGEPEITRTLDSARNGGRSRTPAPGHQAEAGET